MPVTLSDVNTDTVRRALAHLFKDTHDAKARDLLLCLNMRGELDDAAARHMDQWPGYRPLGAPVTAVQGPAPVPPEGLGGCPHLVSVPGVLPRATCSAEAAQLAHAGPDARVTCEVGHVSAAELWPGYRAPSPAPAPVRDAARVAVGDRLVRLHVAMTPQGWTVPYCGTGTVHRVNPGDVPGHSISWAVDWDASAKNPAHRGLLWSFSWWRDGTANVDGGNGETDMPPEFSGVALLADARTLEAHLRGVLLEWNAAQRRDLDRVAVACPIFADSLVSL